MKVLYSTWRQGLVLLFSLFVGSQLSATTCAQAAVVGSLPYTASVVCSGGNDITSTNAAVCAPATASYYGGQEALLVYTANFSGGMNVAYNGQSWTMIAVYNGCPTSGGTCLGGISSSTTAKDLTVSVVSGNTYYILIDTWPAPPSPCPGTVTITSAAAPPGPPANDACANAIPISCVSGGTASGTTVNATVDALPTCGTTITSPGVWYSFVAGVVPSITVSTCGGATWDTKLSVFTGNCGALVCVGGNDDACSLQSSYTINNPVVGATYYVLVHGFSAATGPFTLSVSNCGSIPVVTNDACASATAISCAQSPTGSGSTIGATVDVVPACGTSVTAPGVWYKFTANVYQMFYNVSTCNKTSFDTKLSVYVGSCGNLVCIGSNDNAPGCSGGSSDLTFRPVWGAEHYLLVHGAGSQTGTYQLSLTCGVNPFPIMQDEPGNTVGSGKIALFPNPAQEVINVNVSDYMGRTAIATVFNNVGQMVTQRNLGEIQIPTERIELGNLPSGVYYLSLNVEGEGVFTEKFLVNGNRP
jgi:hypothetical protein